MMEHFKKHAKKYLFAIGAIFYITLRVYAYYTPSKEDDMIADKVKDALIILANEDTDEDKKA